MVAYRIQMFLHFILFVYEADLHCKSTVFGSDTSCDCLWSSFTANRRIPFSILIRSCMFLSSVNMFLQ